MADMGVDELVEVFARHLERNVSLDDPNGRVVAHAAVDRGIDRARMEAVLMKVSAPDVRRREAVAHDHAEPFHLPADREAELFGRLGVPLFHRGFRVATVWIQGRDYEDDLATAEAGLPALSARLDELSALLAERTSPLNFGGSIDERFAVLLAEGGADAARAGIRARIGEPYRVVVLLPVLPVLPTGREVSGTRIQRGLTHALVTATARLRYAFIGGAVGGAGSGAVGETGEAVGVLVLPGRMPLQDQDVLITRLDDQLRQDVDIELLAHGTSDETAIEADPLEAFRRARTAAQARAVDPSVNGRWEDAGVYRFLASVGIRSGDGAGAGARADGGVHTNASADPLAVVDEAKDAELLLTTLEAVYDFAGPKAALADTLHLHRTTLYGRLARIEKLIGANPLDPQVRLELHLTLKARRWARRPLRAD